MDVGGGSSYAVGGQWPSSGVGVHRADAPAPMHDLDVLPAPRPARMHWSTLVLVAGMGICFVALLVTIAGVPAGMAYDVDGQPERNKPTSSDPMQLSKSLDGNMKWIDQHSADAEGGYVGYIKSINRSEAAIAGMVEAVAAMNGAILAIDQSMASVEANSRAMGADMRAMTDATGSSAAAMAGVADNVGFLSKTMLSLAAATTDLTDRMTGIKSKAAGIATDGTSKALEATRGLNSSLPANVPPPVLDKGTTVAVAPVATRGAGTGGGTTGRATAPATAPSPGTAPGRGAQPAGPPAGTTGAAQ